jgi:hypothetical protein
LAPLRLNVDGTDGPDGQDVPDPPPPAAVELDSEQADVVPCECPEAVASKKLQVSLFEALKAHHEKTVTDKLIWSSGTSAVVILAIAVASLSFTVFSRRG